MLHIRSSNSISGPNTSNRNIINSFLSKHYTFGVLVHDPVKGFFKNLFTVFSLVKQIKNFNPDVVHVSGLQRAGFEAVIAARFCRKKVLLTVRGSSTDAITFNKKFLYGKIIEPVTLKLSHKIYAVCDAMAKRSYIQKYSNGRLLETIHNCAPIIDYAAIRPYGLREKYKINSTDILIAIVGRMIYDKGITFINEAIKKGSYENVVFVFIGYGPLIEQTNIDLSELISQNRVIILGHQPEVIPILKECDIFLFATLHENLSNALLEACSLKLAVIATDVGGNPEVIEDGYNGLLIPPENSEAILTAISTLVLDENMRRVLGNNAARTMVEKFSQYELLEKLSRVYSDLIKQHM